MLRFGLILAGFAAVLGLIASYPIDSVRITSMPLLMVSGVLWAAAVPLILLSSAARGGRGDEPPGHIRP